MERLLRKNTREFGTLRFSRSDAANQGKNETFFKILKHKEKIIYAKTFYGLKSIEKDFLCLNVKKAKYYITVPEFLKILNKKMIATEKELKEFLTKKMGLSITIDENFYKKFA